MIEFRCTKDKDSTTHALCGDCCRLWLWTDLIPSENCPPGLCPTCGGEACHCAFCMTTMNHLAAGEFDKAMKSFQYPATTAILSWSAEGGIVTKQLSNTDRPEE